MFDKNDARVEQERAEAEEKRQRRRRCRREPLGIDRLEKQRVGLEIGYPMVNCHIAMDNHHAIHGKINDFYGHVQ